MGCQLSDKAVNVHLYISQPPKSVRSAALEEQIATNENLARWAPTVQIRWLPAKHMYRINSAVCALRNNQRQYCLRFGDGWILPMSLYNAYMDEYRRLLDQFNNAILVMDAKHQEILDDAKQMAGNHAPTSLYPNYFEKNFRIQHNISAIADPNHWQRHLNHDARVEMVESFNNLLKAGQADATADALSRVYDKVNHLANKLADPDAIIRNSAVTNITEIIELLPHFNLTDDPTLTQLYYDIKDRLANLSANDLRNMPMFRADQAATLKSTANHINEIIERIHGTQP